MTSSRASLKNISLIFFGTPKFALPTLSTLIRMRANISAVVTKPDEPSGRNRALTPPPIKQMARKHHIPVFQPEAINAKWWNAHMPKADLFVVAAYGKIIPSEILALPQRGALNIHPSLLPRWRGPSPLQSAILTGDTETGVTIIKLDELMDHGPIVASYKLSMPFCATYPQLHDKLAIIGARLLVETLPRYCANKIIPKPQDDAQATFSKLLTKDDGRIIWTRSAEEIERMTRAFSPWPGAWTIWPAADKLHRIRIEKALAVPQDPDQGSCGYAWRSSKYPLLIKTGHGSIAVQKITLEGKKSLSPEAFLRGHAALIGATLI